MAIIKVLSGLLISIIIIALLITFTKIGDQVDTPKKITKSDYEVHMGEKIVLGKDTLTVVNYNTFLETFTLNNGVEVNRYVIMDKEVGNEF